MYCRCSTYVFSCFKAYIVVFTFMRNVRDCVHVCVGKEQFCCEIVYPFIVVAINTCDLMDSKAQLIIAVLFFRKLSLLR